MVRINLRSGSTDLGPRTILRITADTLTEEDRDRILEIMTVNLDESPLQVQYFSDVPKAKFDYVLQMLGTAFHPRAQEDKAIASDIYVSRSNDGTIQSVMSYKVPREKYGDTQSKFTYHSNFSKQLEHIPGRLEWIRSLEPTIRRLDRSVGNNTKRGIEVCWLETAREARSLGHGSALLECLKCTSEEEHLPFLLLTANDDALRLYKRRGCELAGDATITSPDGGNFILSILTYTPKSGIKFRKRDADSYIHSFVNMTYLISDYCST